MWDLPSTDRLPIELLFWATEATIMELKSYSQR